MSTMIATPHDSMTVESEIDRQMEELVRKQLSGKASAHERALYQELVVRRGKLMSPSTERIHTLIARRRRTG